MFLLARNFGPYLSVCCAARDCSRSSCLLQGRARVPVLIYSALMPTSFPMLCAKRKSPRLLQDLSTPPSASIKQAPEGIS